MIRRKRSREGVAIIGMSCRFPGAANVNEFWKNLCDGVESISYFSTDDLIAAEVDPGVLQSPNFVPAGSVLEDVDLFDANFFGFSPREAESLDPQQRIFLETAWHALEDAGYDPQACAGLIGVYAGCGMSTYYDHLQNNPFFTELLGYLQLYIGNEKDYLATRVSYKFNLKGPSFTIQTACSTSLVAVAVACGDLLSRRCDLALAGAVNIRVPQKSGYYFEPGGIFSPDGHCRVFDEEARGVVFGNGVGVVLLKRLEDAVADRDSIYGVIKGYAINNDGSAKASFTAPSIEGQAEVITLAQKRAGVSPDTITYVEAHGTGTTLGDPIEVAALTRAFRARTKRKQFCALGSVKTNVGHLDSAAGVASLIKTLLALQHRHIPASLNCLKPNPSIDFANSPFYVNTRLSDWNVAGGIPRRAGISAFGIGGTNVHLIVEEAPDPEAKSNSERTDHLIVLSARSKQALEAATDNLVEFLELKPSVGSSDLTYTYQLGRKAFNHRRALVFRDLEDLVLALKETNPRRLLSSAGTPRERPVVFMFSGQGSQYVNMASGLYSSEPAFRTNLDACADALIPHIGLDLRNLIYPSHGGVEESEAQLTQTRITQPALFSIGYAVAQLWREWGIEPDAMIGHSIGEYVAACLAGVFSLEDGLALVAERGRLMQALPGGSMLAIPLPESEVQTKLNGQLDLAAINEVGSCVVSGSTEKIEKLQELLLAAGVQTRRLRISHAFHSRMMDPVLDEFAARVAKIELRAPRIRYMSNVTGDWISAADAMSANYWAQHIRQPVRFAEGIGRLLEEQERIYLEVGPGQALCTCVRRHPNMSMGNLVLRSLRHSDERARDTAVLLDSLARIWLSGGRVDWARFNKHEPSGRIHAPTYPFERQRYWAEVPGVGDNTPPAIAKEPNLTDWFYVPSWEYGPLLDEETHNIPPNNQTAHWLIFEDADRFGAKGDTRGFTASVVHRLRRSGHEVVSVRPGADFVEHSSNEYEIDPKQLVSYQKLLGVLKDAGRLPDKVVHAWSLGSSKMVEPEANLFEHYQNVGFFSVLKLVQGLVKLRVTKPVQIVTVTNGLHFVTGDEQLFPDKATILGACKTVPQEFPNITCRNLDIDLYSAEGRMRDETAAGLFAMFSEECADTVVSYRRGQRWVQAFEPLPLGEASEAIPLLRESGVYILTGGLGNIGLAISEFLARTVRAKLVLLTHSDFPKREDWNDWLENHASDEPKSVKIRRLQNVESFGSEVHVFRGNVAEEDELRKVFVEVNARIGKVNGVIHAAGNLSADAFFGVDQADHDLCDLQFQSKIRGLVALKQVLQGAKIDFVICMSSISSVLAGLGYVAYSAANIFMDTFAHKHTKEGEFPWVSINWDTWAFGGDPAADLDSSRLEMLPEEGLDALGRILSGAVLPQIVVSTGDLWARIDRWIDPRHLREINDAEKRNSAAGLHSRPETGTTYKGPSNSTERAIAEIWQEMLGIARVGVLDHFFLDLNGSSLLATQITAKLRAQFQVDLPLRQFFEGPTVQELASAIDAQLERVPEPANS